MTATRRAAAGGETIGGRFFGGGQFIPASVLASSGTSSVSLFGRSGPRLNSRAGKSVLVSGFEEIDALLKEFPRKVAIPIIVSTLSAGLQAAVRSIRKQVPPATTKGHDTRSIKRSVGRSSNSTIRRLAKGYRVRAKVGIGVGSGNKRQAKHAQAYVAGTDFRFRGAKGGLASTGRVEPHDIVTQGIAAGQAEILGRMRKAGAKAFDRKVRQLAAKHNKAGGRAAGAAIKGVLS